MVALNPDGNSIPITRHNKLEYIPQVSWYHLTKQIKRQSDIHFQRIFSMTDPGMWIMITDTTAYSSHESVDRIFNKKYN